MLLHTLLAAGGGNITDINVWTMFWAWASFLVTLYLLSKVAWPMLQAQMEEREIRIREGLEKAAEAERRATELMEKQESNLQEARVDAQKLLAQGRAPPAHIKDEATSAAREEIQAERDRAKKEIALERGKAVAELRRAAVDLTLDAASRVLEREIKDEDHRRLAEQVISEVDRLK